MCARLLRREHQHLGVPSSFTIYDDGDTERLISGIVRDLDIDPKRFPPKQMAAAIGHAKDRVLDADAFAGMASNFYEEIVAKVYSAYETRKHDGRRPRLRRPDHRDGAAVPRPPRGAPPLPGAVPVPAGRRVPGHEPRPVRAGERARGAATATSASSATPTRASTRGAARPSRTCSTSSATIPTHRSS